MRFTFVRHGQSVANVSGRWQGHGDAPLSEHGERQAAMLGARLGAGFDRVVSSDLTRARRTAEALGLPLVTDPGFREIDVGRWEGLTRGEVLERFPDEIAALFRGEDVAIGGGESWSQVTMRAEAALERLKASTTPGEHVAIVCHGGIISALFLRFLGVRARRPQPIGRIVNTSISELRFEDDGPVVARYNDALHTAPEGAWARSEFSSEDAIVSYVAWDGATPFDLDERELGARFLADVSAVHTADGERSPLADALAELVGVEPSAEPFSPEGFERRGQRVVVVAPPALVHERAKMLVAPYADRPELAEPTPGSITSIACTQTLALVADYNVGPLVTPR